MAGILALGFTLRAYKLLSMFPILVDESIYLRWAEIIDHQGQWFISLLDGKQPLTYWILAVLRKISDVDPLLQGRLLSVFAGLLSTIGVFAIGRRLGGGSGGAAFGFLLRLLPLRAAVRSLGLYGGICQSLRRGHVSSAWPLF